ncbi:DUF2461 family protein [Kribbella sp. NPDC051620]|uniref:DUF2461 family protein n=1 Tax=Kribbella sp. NPDC051620 TaxID=3364120 RepID=UPI00378CFC24
MTGGFAGWPSGAFEVLLELDGVPSLEVRQRCRRDREELVRRPMVELLDAMAERDADYEDFAVWRYGGVMLEAWQRQGAIVRLSRNVELSLRLDLDGLEISAAWWYGPSEQIERYRAAVADPTSGPRLAAILRKLERQEFVISGDLLKRPLRGHPADHPRAQLLRHRSLIATRPLGCDDWIHTASATDRVHDTFTQLRPLTRWLADHVS